VEIAGKPDIKIPNIQSNLWKWKSGRWWL